MCREAAAWACIKWGEVGVVVTDDAEEVGEC